MSFSRPTIHKYIYIYIRKKKSKKKIKMEKKNRFFNSSHDYLFLSPIFLSPIILEFFFLLPIFLSLIILEFLFLAPIFLFFILFFYGCIRIAYEKLFSYSNYII